MPRPVLRDGQGDFRGGLNVTADEETLAPNEVRRADEAVLDEYGAIKKRAGTQRLSDTPLGVGGLLLQEDGFSLLTEASDTLVVDGTEFGGTVQGGFAWLRDDGSQQLLAVSNRYLQVSSYGIPATWTQQVGRLGTGAVSFVSFRDATSEVVYFADGLTTGPVLSKWNGTTPTLRVASTPAGITQLAVYNQRLFGCTGTDQKIYWSGLNNGDSLGIPASDGGVAIIRTFSDQNVTALAAYGSSLLVFHVSGISRFTGLTQDDIAIAAGAQGVTSDVGAIGGRSVVTTPQGVYFLSDRGFYVATDTGVQPISLKLDRLVQGLDLAQAANVIGVHRRALKEVWWFIPDKGVYRYNYALNAWTGPCQGGYLAPVTTALWDATDDDRQPIVLRGDASGYVSQCDMPGIYKDNASATGIGGSSFALAVRCRRLFMGDPMAMKAYKWVYVQVGLAASSQGSVTWLTPNGSSAYMLPNAGVTVAEWGTGTWGTGTWGAGRVAPVRVPVNGYGPHIDILISDSGNAQSVWGRVEVEGFDYGRRY